MSFTRCVVLQAFVCGLIGSSTTCADGFFRRLPEVGEYAIYDTVVVVVSNVGDIAQEIPEFTGTLTLQCVGKTTIDETEHYWIEIALDLENSTQPFGATWKLLVAESDLIDGDPVANFSRGWQRFSGAMDPAPLTADSLMDSTSPTPLFLRAVFCGIEGEVETLNQAQTALINGNEVLIEAAEHGNFAPVELSSTPDTTEPLTGWGTWWLHDEAAFGVAAAEQLWTVEVADAGPVEYAIQCSLQETGADAVTTLPDSE